MIKGRLVGLRALESADLPQARDWRNNTSFRRNFREHRELNLLTQQKWFERVSNSANDYMFGVVRLEDNLLIGIAGLVYVSWIIRSADISMYIGHEELYIDDHGYAEETARLLSHYAFDNLNLHKVWTELYEYDEKKITLFTKLGFERDGTLRDNCYEDGRYWNSYIYSLLNPHDLSK
jgi:RimJ/RimL family protein N-acetyltransferase